MNHYFTNNPDIKNKEQHHKIKINHQDFIFTTDNGVFSKKGLDFGTRTLLECLPSLSGKILDFGCGYGPIGIYIKKNNDVEVDMIDINERSIALAHKNAKLNNVDVNIFVSNTYENVTDKYNYIITNPPIRIGKEKLYEILIDAKKYLKKNGELWLVINKNQGAKTLSKDLEKYYKTTIESKNKGFYIIKSVND